MGRWRESGRSCGRENGEQNIWGKKFQLNKNLDLELLMINNMFKIT